MTRDQIVSTLAEISSLISSLESAVQEGRDTTADRLQGIISERWDAVADDITALVYPTYERSQGADVVTGEIPGVPAA